MTQRKFCPICKEHGRRSRVTGHGNIRKLVAWSPYWDEDGVYHRHDPNDVVEDFSCSNGHRWIETRLEPCPADECDYGKAEPELTVLTPGSSEADNESRRTEDD